MRGHQILVERGKLHLDTNGALLRCKTKVRTPAPKKPCSQACSSQVSVKISCLTDLVVVTQLPSQSRLHEFYSTSTQGDGGSNWADLNTFPRLQRDQTSKRHTLPSQPGGSPPLHTLSSWRQLAVEPPRNPTISRFCGEPTWKIMKKFAVKQRIRPTGEQASGPEFHRVVVDQQQDDTSKQQGLLHCIWWRFAMENHNFSQANHRHKKAIFHSYVKILEGMDGPMDSCASVLLWCLQKGRKQIEGSHRPDGLILFSEKWSGAELLRIDLCRGGNRKSRWDKIFFFGLAPQNIHQMDEGSGGGVKPFVKTRWLISDGCKNIKNEVSAPCIWELRGCRSTSVSHPKDQDGNPGTWKSRENMHKPRASKQLDILHFISSMTDCRSLLFLTPSCLSSAWTVARGRTPGHALSAQVVDQNLRSATGMPRSHT